MDKIDVVFYINLAHRADRREHIDAQFEKVNIPKSKIQRIDAIKKTPGSLGCTMSHIKALETFLANPSLKTALVLEDDFTFRAETPAKLDEQLNLIFTNFPSWEVVNLTAHPERLAYLDTTVPGIKKSLSVLSTIGYMVTRPMALKLLNNWHIVKRLNEELGAHGHTALDVSWTSLQPQANWYLFWPAIGNQCEGYSDVLNANSMSGW
jgi:GR25 family glycosyltransferase involved in LPS biosynthesis